MKNTSLFKIAPAVVFTALFSTGYGQVFNSGSDGSLGPLNIGLNQDVTLTVPANGIFNFTTISVSAGAVLRFRRNALNTPVYLLATGDVVVAGEIPQVTGPSGVTVGGGGPAGAGGGGAGGPGGFDGGRANSDGLGPGAGRKGGDGTDAGSAGGGSYTTVGGGTSSTNAGAIYGSALAVPIAGGSGGGGTPDTGGGGGGGAIVIASNTRITCNGGIYATGGPGKPGCGNAGSGGAIRLVAPSVQGAGGLVVTGGGAGGGSGRVRVDLMDRTGFGMGSVGVSVGSFMTVFPPGNPRLDVIQAADTVIPEGTNSSVTILLPFGSSTNRTVTVQARNFGSVVPIELVLTPQLGSTVKVQTNIDNTTINPATVTVPVSFEINTPTAVNAWTR